MDTDARELELLQLLEDEGWRAIKAIAESFDPPIEKPFSGWDDAIPLIIEAEASKAKPVSRPAPKPRQQKLVQHQMKAWYEGNFMPRCAGCGGPIRKYGDGTVICSVPENRDRCYQDQPQ